MSTTTLYVDGSFERAVREAHAHFIETREPILVHVTPPGHGDIYYINFEELQRMWEYMKLPTKNCSSGTCG